MDRHGNRQKHLNPNPIQRALLDKFHQRVVTLIRQTGVTCLLDAGSGEGFVLKHLQQAQASPITIMGGDFSADALVWGRDHLEHHAPLTQFDVHHLPFPDNHFPLVICLEVLEHLPDSTVGLRELARVSAEYVLLSVPHEPFFRGANFLRGKHLRALGNDPEHFHNYSGRSFKRMLSCVVDVVWHGYSFPWQIALGRKRS
ncbi:MAG: methyltransferase domain-containing protein [Anaerolineales bacterium]|nr:methyltransferase domain-containing protein [Anaerolineales bacterium]